MSVYTIPLKPANYSLSRRWQHLRENINWLLFTQNGTQYYVFNILAIKKSKYII